MGHSDVADIAAALALSSFVGLLDFQSPLQVQNKLDLVGAIKLAVDDVATDDASKRSVVLVACSSLETAKESANTCFINDDVFVCEDLPDMMRFLGKYRTPRDDSIVIFTTSGVVLGLVLYSHYIEQFNQPFIFSIVLKDLELFDKNSLLLGCLIMNFWETKNLLFFLHNISSFLFVSKTELALSLYWDCLSSLDPLSLKRIRIFNKNPINYVNNDTSSLSNIAPVISYTNLEKLPQIEVIEIIKMKDPIEQSRLIIDGLIKDFIDIGMKLNNVVIFVPKINVVEWNNFKSHFNDKVIFYRGIQDKVELNTSNKFIIVVEISMDNINAINKVFSIDATINFNEQYIVKYDTVLDINISELIECSYDINNKIILCANNPDKFKRTKRSIKLVKEKTVDNIPSNMENIKDYLSRDSLPYIYFALMCTNGINFKPLDEFKFIIPFTIDFYCLGIRKMHQLSLLNDYASISKLSTNTFFLSISSGFEYSINYLIVIIEFARQNSKYLHYVTKLIALLIVQENRNESVFKNDTELFVNSMVDKTSDFITFMNIMNNVDIQNLSIDDYAKKLNLDVGILNDALCLNDKLLKILKYLNRFSDINIIISENNSNYHEDLKLFKKSLINSFMVAFSTNIFIKSDKNNTYKRIGSDEQYFDNIIISLTSPFNNESLPNKYPKAFFAHSIKCKILENTQKYVKILKDVQHVKMKDIKSLYNYLL